MKSTMIGFIVAVAMMAIASVQARYIEEMKGGFVIPCEGELCHQTLFCWRGARYADLNKVTSRVRARVLFNDTRDTCVDAESDDVLSLKALFTGHDNETAAVRLSDRIGRERGWISSWVLGALLGQHKVTGDGECHGTECTLQFSPYGLSCIRLCSPPATDGRLIKAEVDFNLENAIDGRAVYLWAIGFALAAAAPALAERPEMFYLTGGSLGVMFAVALLVLILSRMVTRSGPTKGQLGVAAFFQVGVVYMRNAVLEFVRNYIDWIALYVFVTFVASLGLVHYFLKGEDGRVRLSPSLKDIVRTALQLLGAFFMAIPIPSARYRLITMATVFAAEAFMNWKAGGFIPLFFGQPVKAASMRDGSRIASGKKLTSATHSDDEDGEGEDQEEEQVLYQPSSSAKTPQRSQTGLASGKSLSGSRYLTNEEYEALGKDYTEREIKKLLTPSQPVSQKELNALEWLRQNHNKVFVRKDDEDEDVESEEDDEEEETDD